MQMGKTDRRSWIGQGLATGLWVFGVGCLGVKAQEVVDPNAMHFEVFLVWGTNGKKPEDQTLKPLPPTILKKLKGVFKWQDYYVVSRKTKAVSLRKMELVKMSSKCDLKITHQGDSQIEVELYGEKKLVLKKKQRIVPEELVVLAGDDKNDTAWFVILRQYDPRKPPKDQLNPETQKN